MAGGFVSLRRKYKIGAILLVVLAVVTYGRVANLDEKIAQDEDFRRNDGFENFDDELDMLDGKLQREQMTSDASNGLDNLLTHYLQNEMDELERKSKRVIRLYKYATNKRGAPGLH